MSVWTFLYGNEGRDTLTNVERSWQSLATTANTDDVDAAVFVEVDEGDKGYSDHALIRRYFTGWQQKFMRRMVVILVNAKHSTTGERVTIARNSAVRRWSPLRYVAELTIPADRGPDLCLIGVHYPAGYKNGNRPAWARPLLAVSWLNTRRKHRNRVLAAARRGEHSVTLMDSNDHHYDTGYLHPAAVTLFGGGSDWGIAVPAPGWRVASSDDVHVPTYIERYHQGHKVTVTFRRARP